MSFYKAAMDPAIFADPDRFRPERWMDSSQNAFDSDRHVLPFGRGSRVCIGQPLVLQYWPHLIQVYQLGIYSLSYAQLYVLLAAILRRVNIELFKTTFERDIKVKGAGPLVEPTRKTKGVRVLVKSVVP